MLSCKDVTRLLSESMDGSLPFGKRVGVRLHLLICAFCARYRRQLLLLRETARHLVAEPEIPGGFGLSPEVKEHIRRTLASR